jgi:hypothetical protein
MRYKGIGGLMLDFLYDYPNWFIGALFVVTALAASMALMFGLRAVLPVRDDKETFDITIRVMPTVLSLTAFVLAFSVVQANTELQRAAKIAADEATGIGQIDRLLVRIDTAATQPARVALAAYAKSIVEDEWPYMKMGHDGFGHATTRERMQAFNDTLHRLELTDAKDAALIREVIEHADQVEDLRDARLREAREALPALFWVVIGFLALMMMALGAFLRPTLTNVVMVGAQGAAVGLLASFLFMLDHPFMGQTSITPWMLERVMTTLSVKP